MSREVIQTHNAPKPIGPYSQGINAQGHFIFLAGQVGVDPATGKLVEGGIEAETRRALDNVKAILEAAGISLRHVVKTTVLLQNISDFAALNAIYGTYFTEKPPVRTTFGGLQLPANALVEIECIAVLEN